MFTAADIACIPYGLQWVHGPRTVVMLLLLDELLELLLASMGPRSENRGYDSRLENVWLMRFTSFLSSGS